MISKISVEMINSMSLSELDVLRYIDNNREKVIELSIQDLAKEAFVSTATIMRFCKKLGYSGFSELKFFLKEEVQNDDRSLQSTDYESVVSCNLVSITNTIKNLNKEVVDNVVLAMLRAKRIHFFGKGLTESILNYAVKLLYTSGTAVSQYEDTHLAYIMAERMNQDDLLFVASLSGNTHQIVRMAQIAKSRNATVVTITKNDINELTSIGNYSLGVETDGIVTHPADFASRIPMLLVLNIVITMFAGQRNNKK